MEQLLESKCSSFFGSKQAETTKQLVETDLINRFLQHISTLGICFITVLFPCKALVD